ncbi:MAG: transposase, partial [Candidatus Cloacimonetes bacterium]|nr:transposase [Candidatus Cloacimonadota bacterium]
DDPDATYRKKHGKSHKGQVASITETAHPDNALNLIVDVSVQPNNKDDSKILGERLDEIKEKLPELDELHFDGGYGSEDNDRKMEDEKIVPIQTAIRGRKAKLPTSWQIEKDEENNYYVTCPNQQTVKAEPTKTRFKACFKSSICSACANRDKCPTVIQKHCHCYYFNREDFLSKQRHKNICDLPLDKRKIRPNVEASVCEFTRKMNNHKLKVRGAFKAALFVFSVAIAINFGRIYRYSKNISGNLGNNNPFISAIFSLNTIYQVIINKIQHISLQNPKFGYLCLFERRSIKNILHAQN